MTEQKIYDVAVVGGGLAGLTFSVLLAKLGRSVILFEKEKYPFHRVCGEYISMESWNFLVTEIGVSLDNMNVAHINKLLVTAPDGTELKTSLDSGGFGISRYLLDHTIKDIAEQHGVAVKDGCKVDDITFDDSRFIIQTSEGKYKSVCCCGSWGKRSNIDIRHERPFTKKSSGRLNNYVGIKYHVKGNFPDDLISLHNFKDGYCGFSKIEDDKHSLCYFMKASNLVKGSHAIEDAERFILAENPQLKKIFEHAEKIHPVPVTISQVSLNKKTAVEDHVLMLGDAAGMISPLCGNGMSIAMHSAKIASKQVEAFLQNRISRKQMEENYSTERKNAFGSRIATGRFIQSLFGRKTITNIFVRLIKRSKYLTEKLIGFTHGAGF